MRYFFSNEIVVELQHGLSNRLCAFISSKIASREKNKKLKVIWHKNYECGCDFSDLFDDRIELTNRGIIVDFNDDCDGREEFLVKTKTMFYEDPSFHKFLKKEFDYQAFHNIQFFSGEIDEAARLFSHELNGLMIKNDILDKIINLPPKTIGIHIRKTDSKWLKYVDESSFINRIDRFLEEDGDIHFFLATDSYDVRLKLLDRFGNKIIHYDTDLYRGSGNRFIKRQEINGMQDALMELITLSRTTRIIGSYNSSFSWLASIWGLIPLEIASCIPIQNSFIALNKYV